jgi:hypothetical protein
MKNINHTILFFGLLTIYQTATSITNLQTPALDEKILASFYNDNIITHNDSGGQVNLYEINASTGAVAKNSCNNECYKCNRIAKMFYIYIGDIGNNFGNRTDLKKIYKISEKKTTMDDDTAAKKISYSYTNQLDFPKLNNN